jgi:hypothetical protein
VAKVLIDGKEYQSEPTDLTPGVNLVPVQAERLTRHVVVGGPTLLPPAKSDNPRGK